MADARVDAEPLARGVPDSEIPLPWRPFFDRNERRHGRGLASMFCARISTDLNRPSAPIRCCVCSIALRRNRSPGAYASRLRMMRSSTRRLPAMSTGPKNPSVPGFGAHDHARPCRVDRLARDADLRVRVP